MEGEKAVQHCVVEWSIENFTCWNNQIHGECILPDLPIETINFKLELYPKGIKALEEYLLVRIYDKKCENNGRLSIIDSKGSLLWKKTIRNQTWKNDYKEITANLIFKDVVKNTVQDPFFKDVITLRYTNKFSYNIVNHNYTKLDAFDRLFRIPSEILSDLPLTNKINAVFCYNFGGFKRYDFAVSSIQSTVDGTECSFELDAGDDVSNVVHCYLYVLNSDNSSIMFKEIEHIFAEGKSWQFKHTLPNHIIKELFSLLIHFKIISSEGYRHFEYFSHDPKKLGISNILHSSTENYSKSVIEQPENSVGLLSKEFMCLYQDHDFSDFRLRCESVAFPVHKNILSARSPVFKCMLTSDMKEAGSGCLDIKDLDPHTLGRFLAFLYSADATGEAQLQWESALKLYYAADKYQVPSLKAECATVLKDQVSVSNVCDILALADKHQDEHLTSFARDFISRNHSEVMQSEEWMRFMEKDSLLLCKTLTILVKNRKFT